MPTLQLDGRLIYFAHCPKAGGTSVERFMVDRWADRVGMLGWGWDRAWAGRGERQGEIPCSPQHLVWADAERVLERTPDRVFALVRDPVARMISEYRYQREHRLTGPAGRPLRWLDFSTWLRLMARVVGRNPYAFDNHFRPQTAFLPPVGAVVFRLEDGPDRVGDWLLAEAGEAGQALFPRELRSERREGRILLWRQDLHFISELYAGDYLRFGYPLPDLSAAPEDSHAARRQAVARVLSPAIGRLYRRGLL